MKLLQQLLQNASQLFFQPKNEKPSAVKTFFNVLLLAAAAVFLVSLSLKKIDVTLDYSFVKDVSFRIKSGFILTVGLSLCSMVISLCIGILSALAHESRFLPLQYLFKGYVMLIRGTPLLAQIYLFFYIIGTAWGIESRFLSGVMILSVFEGAYISEIIRGSLLSIEQTQIEAGMAIGLSRGGIVKEIIIPQMTARTLPALAGQFASVIKDSSLLSVISVTELSQTMREISSLNFKMFECYFLLAVLYLVLTLPVTLFSKWLERRFGYEN